MVALDLPYTSHEAETFLTAFGRETEFSTWYDAYPAPVDVDLCMRLFSANCGPASFAALTGLLVTEIMRFFPHFPESSHTNIPQMNAALSACGIRAADGGNDWPQNGLCLLQICGPWTDRGWPGAACRHRHWVAVRNGYVYDVNVNQWLTKKRWESTVMSKLAAAHPRSTGWRLSKALSVEVQPVAFPEFSSLDRRKSVGG